MSEYKKYDFDEKGFTAEYRAGFGEFILNDQPFLHFAKEKCDRLK